jgi:hypothetical protein
LEYGRHAPLTSGRVGVQPLWVKRPALLDGGLDPASKALKVMLAAAAICDHDSLHADPSVSLRLVSAWLLIIPAG